MTRRSDAPYFVPASPLGRLAALIGYDAVDRAVAAGAANLVAAVALCILDVPHLWPQVATVLLDSTWDIDRELIRTNPPVAVMAFAEAACETSGWGSPPANQQENQT